MKSKLVSIKYVYGSGDIFQMDEPLRDVLYAIQADKEVDLFDWVEDDTWLTLPVSNFNVTQLKLDSKGQPVSIRFTERKLRG